MLTNNERYFANVNNYEELKNIIYYIIYMHQKKDLKRLIIHTIVI